MRKILWSCRLTVVMMLAGCGASATMAQQPLSLAEMAAKAANTRVHAWAGPVLEDANATFAALFRVAGLPPPPRVAISYPLSPEPVSRCGEEDPTGLPVYCFPTGEIIIQGLIYERELQGKIITTTLGRNLLIAHEVAHHVQRRLPAYARFAELRPRDIMGPWWRRRELHADCLAGVWLRKSTSFAVGEAAEAEIIEAARRLGTDNVVATRKLPSPGRNDTHGDGEARAQAVMQGFRAGSLNACDKLLLD